MKDITYTAKLPDPLGYVAYDETENQTWEMLCNEQNKNIRHFACEEFINGLETLDMPKHRIPQISEINEKLLAATGWQVEAVPALIPHQQFFKMLARKHFPAATFIRRREHLHYIEEPDIFHEFYGHCPLLTDPVFANFMENFGNAAMNQPEAIQTLYARLYWFTIEVGLILNSNGLRVYGGGILSSIDELPYATQAPLCSRWPAQLERILKTEYRIDRLQKTYFIIDDFSELNTLLDQLPKAIAELKTVG